MPDGDVFDSNVKRGWQTASRRMIGTGDDPDARPSVLRALGREIRSNGCPGFDQIVGIIADAIRSPPSRMARRLAVAQLEFLRLQQGNRATEIAVASARSLLASAPESCLSVSETADKGELHMHLAVLILADIADASMCPAVLLAEIVEGGEASFQEIRSRRERAKDMIAGAPEACRLAVQLLADPSGASVRTPRLRRVRMSQSEILATALTP